MGFTKKDLKTGMFGVTTNGCKFVIVNNLLVYRDGDYDIIADMTNDLRFTNYSVEKLFSGCRSFSDLDFCLEDNNYEIYWELVYDRNAECAMTISEIEARLGIKNLKIIKEDN